MASSIVVVSILWSRLGTRLPKGFTRADGSRYDSGTEYEFEDALEGFRRNGKPGVGLGIVKQSVANTLDVAKAATRVCELMRRKSKARPARSRRWS